MRNLQILALMLLSFSTLAQKTGTITRVYDGDTYQLRTFDSTFTIRILYIDTPESQTYYTRDKVVQQGAKMVSDSVRALLRNKNVTYQFFGKDEFKRPLMMLWLDGQRVDSLLLVKGYAWFVPLSVNAPKNVRLKNGLWLQRQAQTNGVGIFDKTRFSLRTIRPSTFRKNHSR